MADETFTQEQVNEAIADAKLEWVNNELDPLVAERDDLLQYKPKDLTEEEKAFKQQQQDLFNDKVEFHLEKNGLTQFKDIIKVENDEELTTTIRALSKVMNDVKLSAGYIPKDKAKDDEYTKFAKEGNTQGMIASKLSNLFK